MPSEFAPQLSQLPSGARGQRKLIRATALTLSSHLLACMTPPATSHPKAAESPDQKAAASSYPGPAELKLSEPEREATAAAALKLRQTLAALAAPGRFALGHEDTTAYGVGWAAEPDRSDPKSLCGSHPAVHGWDLFGIEVNAAQNGDGVHFELMRRRIQEAHARGGINTISWHLNNPVSGGDAWDTARAVGAVIPGGSRHQLYTVYLDRAADFLQSCRGAQGELIPIIFRPFHEHTGSWFWWGASHATESEFVKLWRFTINHLRVRRGLTQLLFAFSPGGGEVQTEHDYLFRYPGDDTVDVMGLDHYYDADAGALVQKLGIATRIAAERGKIAALTEFGVRDGISDATAPDWFSQAFFQPLVNDSSASRIAYALAWRNASPKHFFLPYPTHRTAPDFKEVCADERLLMQDDLPLR